MDKNFLTWKEAQELALKILHDAEQRRLDSAQEEADRNSRLFEED